MKQEDSRSLFYVSRYEMSIIVHAEYESCMLTLRMAGLACISFFAPGFNGLGLHRAYI